MEERRTALDAYRDFGVALQKLIAELVELDVTPTHINKNLEAAGVPPVFAPHIIRVFVNRSMDAKATAGRFAFGEGKLLSGKKING